MTDDKYQKLSFLIVSISHFVTIGTVAIINIAVSNQLTWALYPILSILYAWVITATALLTKNRKLLVTFIVASVFLIPYLILLEVITPANGWFASYALPISILVIVSVWIFFFTFVKLKTKKT